MSKEFPIASEEDRQGRIGVGIVAIRVHKLLKWIFRETASSDVGLDGEIEIREDDTTSHGRIIGVQIKCGPSFLKEQTETGYVYRGALKHLRYWSEHTVPIILVICNPDKEECWWQHLSFEYVNFHEKGWSIEIPFKNKLSQECSNELRAVASRFQKKDLIELLLRDWIGWSSQHTVRIASIMTTPRDWHWIAIRAERGNETLMIDYVLSDLAGFDNAEIAEMHKYAAYNATQYGASKLILAFVSEIIDLLEKMPEPHPIEGVSVEYVPLLLRLSGEPQLIEVGQGHKLVDFYDWGEPMDGWTNPVTLMRKDAPAHSKSTPGADDVTRVTAT